eukprot:28412-Hanusia_phi.AAC.16
MEGTCLKTCQRSSRITQRVGVRTQGRDHCNNTCFEASPGFLEAFLRRTRGIPSPTATGAPTANPLKLLRATESEGSEAYLASKATMCVGLDESAEYRETKMSTTCLPWITAGQRAGSSYISKCRRVLRSS